MAKLLYHLHGVRGREMKLYDTKCVITTRKTAGSFLTGNFSDGEKTIFLCDVVGVQFKESGGLIGYLQLETPSMQMNNKSDNMFSENTFTFENGKNGVTNQQMRQIYDFIVNRIEQIKYGTMRAYTDIQSPPEVNRQEAIAGDQDHQNRPTFERDAPPAVQVKQELEDTYWICSKCKTKNLNARNDCWSCGTAK